VIACLIFISCLWIGRGLAPHTDDPAPQKSSRKMAAIIACMALFQIYLGALVAGLDAGLSYNTWPLMDGSLVPGDLFVIDPAWANLFANAKTVQFIHRCGAYVVFAAVLWHMIATRRRE